MKVSEYKFKMANLHKVPADVAGRVCQTLSETPGGLTPKRLVDVSRAKDAPLHDEFEWDDTVAGELYREQQAQMVIQHLVIVESDSQTERRLKVTNKEKEEERKTEPIQDRGFVSTGERDNRYVTLSSALTNEIWRKNLLEAAKRDCRVFIAKYNRLEELSDIINRMNGFLGA